MANSQETTAISLSHYVDQKASIEVEAERFLPQLCKCPDITPKTRNMQIEQKKMRKLALLRFSTKGAHRSVGYQQIKPETVAA
jgi:hypothetical protein